MCSRYLLARSAEKYARELRVTEFPLPRPRYNAAPTQRLPVVRATAAGGGREAVTARWGLVPAWSPTPRTRTVLLNARAESAAEKPAFRDAFRRRRCLVPADGYFEWRRTAAGPRPWLFEPVDDSPLLLAGLWERWSGPDAEPFESFAILTTAPNAFTAGWHDRMPALLSPAAADAWLEAGTDPATLAQLLAPGPAGALRVRPVHPRINDVAYDAPDALAPPDPEDAAPPQLELGL